MSKAFTLSPVTQTQVDEIVTHLRGGGNSVGDQSTLGSPNKTYSISGHGIDASAVYDPAKSELTVSIQHKPFFVSMDHIEQGIQAALAESSKQP